MLLRVTNMAGIDLRRFRFDYDLTWAALLMNADGTIYHTFAGRDRTSALSHLSMPAFVKVMEQTLDEHRQPRTAPPKLDRRKGQSVENMPRQRPFQKPPECWHCHMVHDAMHDADVAARRKRKETIFVWPDPVQLGLSLDREEQTRVTAVAPGSVASAAGMLPGDRLTGIGESAPLTFGDVQRVLDAAPTGSNRLAIAWEREGEERRATLALRAGWKEATPEVYAWRPYKWNFGPRPGFGGPLLAPAEVKALGLKEGAFAMRVNYIVTWGPHSDTGRNAQQAGLRKGDVVYRVGGESDFESPDHFHAWYRLTRKVGSKVEIDLLRGGKTVSLKLPVME